MQYKRVFRCIFHTELRFELIGLHGAIRTSTEIFHYAPLLALLYIEDGCNHYLVKASKTIMGTGC